MIRWYLILSSTLVFLIHLSSMQSIALSLIHLTVTGLGLMY